MAGKPKAPRSQPRRPRKRKDPVHRVVPVDEAPEMPDVAKHRATEGTASLGEQVEPRRDRGDSKSRLGD